MASWSGYVSDRPAAVFQKAQAAIAVAGFRVTNSIPSQSLSAEGSREYRLWLLILLVIFVWPVAIIYYFTRKKSSIAVGIQDAGNAVYVTLNSSGDKGDQALSGVTMGLTPAGFAPPPGATGPGMPSAAAAAQIGPAAQAGEPPMVRCGTCGTMNRPGTLFCTNCGTKLA